MGLVDALQIFSRTRYLIDIRDNIVELTGCTGFDVKRRSWGLKMY